jgi:excisionase family DNA binding protein
MDSSLTEMAEGLARLQESRRRPSRHREPDPEDGLVNAAAAAELLDVPKSWVLAEARAGRIPHVRLGRYVRFEPDDLRAWWREKRQGPPAARTGP